MRDHGGQPVAGQDGPRRLSEEPDHCARVEVRYVASSAVSTSSCALVSVLETCVHFARTSSNTVVLSD